MGVDTAVGDGSLHEEGDPSVLIDALIGCGLDGNVRGPARGVIERMMRTEVPTVSLKVPSGLSATTGNSLGVSVNPVQTVTLALPKTGLDAISGSLFLADIAVPRTVYEQLEIGYDTPYEVYELGRTSWVTTSKLRYAGLRLSSRVSPATVDVYVTRPRVRQVWTNVRNRGGTRSPRERRTRYGCLSGFGHHFLE